MPPCALLVSVDRMDVPHRTFKALSTRSTSKIPSDKMLFEKLLFFTEQGNANTIYSDTDNSELGGVTNTFVETAPDALYGELYDRESLLPPPDRFCIR